MNRKVKITSNVFAAYLAVLPLLFYLHAIEHNYVFHEEACTEVNQISTEVNEDICDLCDLYSKQQIFHELKLFQEEISLCSFQEFNYYSTASKTPKQFRFLRAPPSKFL